MKNKLVIKLKSDLCASSGESLGSLIDTDICYDNFGLVYIPSKRLKGLLKEAYTEYLDWTDDEEKNKLLVMKEKLFGKEGDNSSCDLKLDNAYIDNIEKIQNDIENVESRYKKYLIKQRVANANTYIRYQTAIDLSTGVAKDNSLRSTRVVESGTSFFSNIECKTEEELEIIKKCLKFLTHMGKNRTRGFGEIVCKLTQSDEENSSKIQYDFADDKNYKISLLLRADSNIMVSKQNSETSENYIPGSNIMGAIASKYIEANNITDFSNFTDEYKNLFINGEVKYSNAYITEKNGKVEYFPAPLSYTKVKNESGIYHNKMYDVLKTDIQLSNLNNQYVSLDGNNYIKDVKQTEHYHHQRAKDLSIGHVSQIEDGGTFYQFTSIDMGQYFLANIETKGKYAKSLIKYFDNEDILRVGKSRTAEYGKLIIKDVNINEIQDKMQSYKKFAVVLTSPVILFDEENVKIANDKETLIKELKKLFASDCLNVTKSFIGYSDESGYNTVWNLPKEQVSSYEKGTTICFETTDGINLKEEYCIGLRKNEGYGKLKILNISENGTSELIINQYKTQAQDEIQYNNLQNLTRKLLNKSIKKVIQEEIQEDVLSIIEEKKISLNNNTIGRILLMLQESNTLDKFMTNVGATKDIKKLQKVLEMINNKDNLYKLTSYQDYQHIFEVNNNKVSESDNNQFILEYIKQLFTILKIKGGENND